MFYGWWVVAGTFVSHLLSYGVLTVAFGVFFPFYDVTGDYRLAFAIFAAAFFAGAGVALAAKPPRAA